MKAAGGKIFSTRLLDVSEKHVIAMGDCVLPYAMGCDLQVVIPPRANSPQPAIYELSGVVQEVVFANGGIRLVFKVEVMPAEIERMIDECGMRKSRSVYVTV